jgi:hypothetical protein
MDRISDELMNLVLFNNTRQQISTAPPGLQQRQAIFLPSVRAGLAFFGKADPPAGDAPAATEEVLSIQPGGYNDLGVAVAAPNAFGADRGKSVVVIARKSGLGTSIHSQAKVDRLLRRRWQ